MIKTDVCLRLFLLKLQIQFILLNYVFDNQAIYFQIKKIINIFFKSQYYQELKVSIDNADNFFLTKIVETLMKLVQILYFSFTL